MNVIFWHSSVSTRVAPFHNGKQRNSPLTSATGAPADTLSTAVSCSLRLLMTARSTGLEDASSTPSASRWNDRRHKESLPVARSGGGQ